MSIDKKALIAQIAQNVQLPPADPTSLERKSKSDDPEKSTTTPKAPTTRRRNTSREKEAVTFGTSTGRQAAFWLDDEDRAIFREVGMNLYSQGIKPSDNLVLRAALRLMPRDHRLLEQIRVLLQNDGRKLRHRGMNPNRPIT